jgi:hypothetical protein
MVTDMMFRIERVDTAVVQNHLTQLEKATGSTPSIYHPPLDTSLMAAQSVPTNNATSLATVHLCSWEANWYMTIRITKKPKKSVL